MMDNVPKFMDMFPAYHLYSMDSGILLINVFTGIDKYGLTWRVVDKLLYGLGGRVLRVPMADGCACT
jgi:hypothetical protein